ncbi:MAG: nucleoside deaminase [Planctomycetes bacterium]|nr:nucleoside deaminase [Planctomycetota bacterium]
MRLAIALAARNIEEGSGGPFGAAVFERTSGRLVAAGMNLVVSARTSVAHAEIVAIILAQARLGTYDLGADDMPALELATSVEPCAMCLGAIHWSGLRGLLCGARDEDARAIGFDEGPKPPAWAEALARGGIDVRRDILREEAASILRRYVTVGGPIYNPCRGGDCRGGDCRGGDCHGGDCHGGEGV